MALLGSCWLIIESFIIPDGFLKWFYLSFYIHTFFLFVCQIFLWLKLLTKWILVVFCYPLRIICLVGFYIFRFFRDCTIFVFSFSKLNSDVDNDHAVEEAENSAVIVSCNQNQIGILYSCSRIAVPSAPCKLKVFEVQKNWLVEDMDMVEYSGADDHEEEKMGAVPISSYLGKGSGMNDEYISSIFYSEFSTNDDDFKEYSSSVCSNNSPARSLNDGDHLNEYSSSVCGSNLVAESLDMNDEHIPTSICTSSTSPVVEREITQRDEYQESAVAGREIIERDDQYQESSDAFYKKYIERMRWFDLLNYDRTCGISAVLNKQLATPSPVESDEPAVDHSVPYVSWSKLTKKRLLRSLESDFEMVYVAQSCLSWEALYYQYTKVKALAHSSSNNGVFYGNVFCELQKFQVLLERFLEDERSEGKRIWNYVRGRFALKGLLEIPHISGFSEEEKEEDVKAGEAVSVKEVLKGIERCIQAFGVFVEVDNNKKPWWKLKTPLWTYPPVEDPRDLDLFRFLTRRLQKKELGLKHLQGKQRCWIKRVANPLEESQRKEMLFTMIDMKLVSRVLQMSTVSSSQLKWCQQKLDNIEIKERKIFRVFTATLFPPS